MRCTAVEMASTQKLEGTDNSRKSENHIKRMLFFFFFSQPLHFVVDLWRVWTCLLRYDSLVL